MEVFRPLKVARRKALPMLCRAGDKLSSNNKMEVVAYFKCSI